jgi:hypothetical protein
MGWCFFQSPITKEGNASVSSETASLQEKSLEPLKPLFGVKKRHSAGEASDRNLKTKSLLISTDLRYLFIYFSLFMLNR